MIGAKQFALMQKHAYFITTARGFIHDEDALADALRNKKIAGAGLDVWAKEPPPPEHPLLQFDNVLASPHTAGVTHEARENMGRIAAQAGAGYARRQAAAAHHQSRGLARLRQAVPEGVRLCAGLTDSAGLPPFGGRKFLPLPGSARQQNHCRRTLRRWRCCYFSRALDTPRGRGHIPDVRWFSWRRRNVGHATSCHFILERTVADRPPCRAVHRDRRGVPAGCRRLARLRYFIRHADDAACSDLKRLDQRLFRQAFVSLLVPQHVERTLRQFDLHPVQRPGGQRMHRHQV